jgi:hypothetical protein
MSTPIVLEGIIPLKRRRGIETPEANRPASPPTPSCHVPRIARLLALAWHVEGLVRAGTVASYAVAARLGHVSRARVVPVSSS